MTESIQILQQAARGLVEAMKRKGYDKAEVTIHVDARGADAHLRTAPSNGPDAFVDGYGSRAYAFVYGKTLSALVDAALSKIVEMKPAVDPDFAATLGIEEVEPGLWREVA